MVTKKNFTCYQNKTTLSQDDVKNSISLDPKDRHFFFHYLYIDRDYNNLPDGYLQIIGAMSTDDYYLGKGTMKYGNHKDLDIYYYERCDESDIYNYDDKIEDKKIFFNSLCIKKMYKFSEKKIISKNDKNFVWPKLNKWVDNKVPAYSIFIRKCLSLDEHTNIRDECHSDEEIENFLQQKMIKMSLYFITYLPNVKNYKNPAVSFIVPFETFTRNNGYPEGVIRNDISKVVIREGFLNVVTKEEVLYSHNTIQYTEVYGKYNLKGIYIMYKNNNFNEYYRTYDDLFLVISKVGGINNGIILIAKLISQIFVKFFHYIDSIDLYEKSKENHSKIRLKKKFDKKFESNEHIDFEKRGNDSSIKKILNSSN